MQISEEKFIEFDAKLNGLHYAIVESDVLPTRNDFKKYDFVLHKNKIYFIDNNEPYEIVNIDQKEFEISLPSSNPNMSLQDKILENEYNLSSNPKYPRLTNHKKPNEVYLINYGSGCKNYDESVDKVDLHLAERVKKLKILVGYEKVSDNNGPSVVIACGFDKNVEKSAKFMLQHIVRSYQNNHGNISDKNPLEINLNLIGYSRGATETIAAYNVLQKYLQGDPAVPPALKKTLDSILNDKIKIQLQYALSNNNVRVITHMLLLDPVRGPTNGNYGIYGKVIEEPFGGKNSEVFVDVCVCNEAMPGRGMIEALKNKILELSHVIIQSDKIHLRHNQTGSSHSDLDRKPTDARSNFLPATLIDYQLGFINLDDLLKIKCNEIIGLLSKNLEYSATSKRKLAINTFIAQLSIIMPMLFESAAIEPQIKRELIIQLLGSNKLDFDNKYRIILILVNNNKIPFNTKDIIVKAVVDSNETYRNKRKLLIKLADSYEIKPENILEYKIL